MIESMTPKDAARDSAEDRFAEARRAMVNSQLRTSDVNMPQIIDVMGRLARENFISEDKHSFTYIDRAIPLGSGRVMNPPLTTGLMLQRAGLEQSDTVLIVGAATGYMTALAADLAGKVVALENDSGLYEKLEHNSAQLENVTTAKGPLAEGHAKAAPYSAILIDGAVETVPESLAQQLTDDGRLICGVADRGVGRLAEGRKASNGSIILTDFVDADIAPLDDFAAPKTYEF